MKRFPDKIYAYSNDENGDEDDIGFVTKIDDVDVPDDDTKVAVYKLHKVGKIKVSREFIED